MRKRLLALVLCVAMGVCLLGILPASAAEETDGGIFFPADLLSSAEKFNEYFVYPQNEDTALINTNIYEDGVMTITDPRNTNSAWRDTATWLNVVSTKVVIPYDRYTVEFDCLMPEIGKHYAFYVNMAAPAAGQTEAEAINTGNTAVNQAVKVTLARLTNTQLQVQFATRTGGGDTNEKDSAGADKVWKIDMIDTADWTHVEAQVEAGSVTLILNEEENLKATFEAEAWTELNGRFVLTYTNEWQMENLQITKASEVISNTPTGEDSYAIVFGSVAVVFLAGVLVCRRRRKAIA